MQLFYNPNIDSASTKVNFDKEESRHIIKVLRKSNGDVLQLTNGKGFFFSATLIGTNPKKCAARITGYEKRAPLDYKLHLAVAPTKSNDRYEWFLEKATEIGVTEITPIICDRSERRTIKAQRYEKIIQSAMKQSLNAYLPTLNSAVSLTEFFASDRVDDEKFIAHCDKSERQTFKNVLSELDLIGKTITILVGPEGDFSEMEIKESLKKDYLPISLSNSRLRTETAAIVACYSVCSAVF